MYRNNTTLRCRCFKIAVRYASSTRQLDKSPLCAAAYQPKLVENKYAEWEKKNLFRAGKKDAETFSMVLPPPNVTGKLHLGHALACTIQDVIVRRQRSLGKNVLWLPGTDHAGIATQGVVEKYLKSKHNVDRRALGREKFNEEVWKWKDRYGSEICDQLRRLGASLDWTRSSFTMNASNTRAVNEAFVRLHDRGLVYRKKALVNWCVQLKSTLSDIEVENFEVPTPMELRLPGYDKPVMFGQMTQFAYKVCDSSEQVVVATTRPETMFGDVALAVHPDDLRYKHLHNSRVHHPFRNETIPIITDGFVDMQLGTGVVKITPAHDKTDYEFSQRHRLEMIEVINEDGEMKEIAGDFKGLKRFECRNVLVERLNDLGVLKNVAPHKMVLPRCSRTGDVIEILPKEQWFVSCREMNKKACDAVKRGGLRIDPENFVKNWDMWTGDERDWCVSRQLWWGHRVPAYKCCHEERSVWVAALDEEEGKMKASKMLQVPEIELIVQRDEDVLDTWFSSGIYPFASLGWPDSTDDLNTYYPLSLMATGHDILGFWVHRMVILGLELTGELPFKNVLLHGIICDSKGAKMSKSRGNVIDPVDVINGITLQDLNSKAEEMAKAGILSTAELQRTKAYNKSNFPNGIPECGVDALRFTLLTTDVKSHFVNFDVNVCHANKLFCNKLWQSVKYTQLSFDKLKGIDNISREDLTKMDLWIMSRLAYMVELANMSIENLDLHVAVNAIRTHLYGEFCDIYLEMTKPGFDGEDSKKAYAHAHTLSTVLNVGLRCLSPFMVYVTDELIPKIPAFEHNIVHNFKDFDHCFQFPLHEDFKCWRNKQIEEEIGAFNDAVTLVRRLKGLYGVPNKVKSNVCIRTSDENISSSILNNAVIFKTLTRCDDISLTGDISGGHVVSAILSEGCTISLQLEQSEESRNLISSAKSKLNIKMNKIKERMKSIEERICNDKYERNAPQSVQISDREKINKLKLELDEFKRMLS